MCCSTNGMSKQPVKCFVTVLVTQRYAKLVHEADLQTDNTTVQVRKSETVVHSYTPLFT